MNYSFQKILLYLLSYLFCCSCVNAQKNYNDITNDLITNKANVDSFIAGWSEQDKLSIINELIVELKNSDDKLNCDWSRIVNDSIKEFLEAGAYKFTLIMDVPPRKIVLMYLIEKVFQKDFNTNYLEIYSVTYSQDSCNIESTKFYICDDNLAKDEYEHCQKPPQSVGCEINKFLFDRLEKAYIEWYEECKEKGLKAMIRQGKSPLSKTNYRWRDAFIEERIEEMRDSSMKKLIEQAKRRYKSNEKK